MKYVAKYTMHLTGVRGQPDTLDKECDVVANSDEIAIQLARDAGVIILRQHKGMPARGIELVGLHRKVDLSPSDRVCKTSGTPLDDIF